MRRALWLWLIAALAIAPRPGLAQVGASDPELNNGLRQVDEGDFEAAVRTLSGVVKRLQGREGQSRELARAHLYLGIAQLGLGAGQDAKAAFALALKNDASLTLSPDEFSPRVIQAFDQARREVMPAPPRPALPTSDPPPPATPPTPPGASSASPPPVKAAPPKTSPVVLLEAAKQGDFAVVRTLLNEDPALLNERDSRFGATSLHWAALRGHQAIVALLIERGADVSVKNNDGETALQVAERAKRDDVVRLLRSAAPAGAGSFAASGGIFEAVKLGDVEAVRRLLEESPTLVNRGDTGFGATPLHWAALRGHEDVARLLLDKGADVNVRNNDGETPLQVAERAKRSGVVQVLRSRGGEASAGIVEAVRAGDLARVQRLLASNPGALNQKDAAFGATPLHWAALRGHADVAKFLVAQGADTSAKNKDGETPLQVAERAKRAEIVALLRAGGGAVSVSSAALIDAVKRGDLERVRVLLGESPGLVNAKDAEFGATPLHWAALRGHADVAEYLVGQGADRRAKNGAGETPLQVAQRAGRADVVRVLSRGGS